MLGIIAIGSSILTNRIEEADTYGVEFQILSYTALDVQDLWKREEAEKAATEINDYIAAKVRGLEDRYACFPLTQESLRTGHQRRDSAASCSLPCL